ncbi:flavodoxin domain-containing protein [Amycolatopsis alkalitolerans]|uniref:Protoporphyrinogen oxidase n=1 Tax=Amycolatopsis alkalitolerans TaxID=2547244 RepID=A0A5C4LRC9_9PSEU|nr:flavodoxin domain-containing protein [Amycolatopsis alkalitolerans]TNC20480.1 protoporphyrinogen oxidase [Amycolatopsis alkalitolerans]
MKVLVCAASRHGATFEIAEEIGFRLGEALGLLGEPAGVSVCRAETVSTVRGYDAAVLGSAVYERRWVESARQLVDQAGDDLALMPVWLFSVGAVGSPLAVVQDPAELGEVRGRTRAYEHRTFVGRVDWPRLATDERAAAVSLQVGTGDYRNWLEIRNWAYTIATTLRAAQEMSPPLASPALASRR